MSLVLTILKLKSLSYFRGTIDWVFRRSESKVCKQVIESLVPYMHLAVRNFLGTSCNAGPFHPSDFSPLILFVLTSVNHKKLQECSAVILGVSSFCFLFRLVGVISFY